MSPSTLDSELNLLEFEKRKESHLKEALNPFSQTASLSGLEQVAIPHDALPELNFDEIQIKSSFLGNELKTPFFVSGMTAGHASASLVNRRLASACARRGWVFGVGSQRRELQKGIPLIDSWSELRSHFPDLVILGNLGLSQLISANLQDVKKLVQNLGANAFAIHLNALQEVIQPEGTPHFKGGLSALKKVIRSLGVPVILKETGCGFSPKTLEKIKGLSLAAVDVSGLGGTHWGRVEGLRTPSRSALAKTFAHWGVSVTDSVIAAKNILPSRTEIWASGGVRTGLDAAKLIGLGAHRVGFAQPALEAALLSEEALDQWMEQIETELKIALFCGGFPHLKALRGQLQKQLQKPKQKRKSR